jgi:hypothetical protein
MADRRSFLGAVSGVAASVLLAAQADAQPESPAAPPASASPAASPPPKPASAAAVAIAASMRRFDPKLSEHDLDTIAHAIDENRRGAARLNPRKATALANADEPVTCFTVAGPR